MRILLVEDEPKVASFIRKGLEEESYVVDVAATGVDGELFATTYHYDLVILDLMLPGKDGIQVCRALRSVGMGAPILMLTARSTMADKVTGLDSGADDYLTKPFAFEEFLARVRALLRRGPSGDPAPLVVGDLVLERSTRRARRAGGEIALTNREFALLEFFMRRRGEVLSRAVLAEHVWGLGFDSESNVIEVTVSHLRGKVDKGQGKQLIHTLRGAGYVMREDADS
ncbi:MAG: response regulator transcription factor [Candidatus Riflebacteria bacterium]|nr:response regulator transcription factor [Candidatus Riflebacteria bacterium]